MKKFILALVGGLVLICSVYLIYTYTIDNTSDESKFDTLPNVTVDEVLGEIDGIMLEEDGDIEIGDMV